MDVDLTREGVDCVVEEGVDGFRAVSHGLHRAGRRAEISTGFVHHLLQGPRISARLRSHNVHSARHVHRLRVLLDVGREDSPRPELEVELELKLFLLSMALEVQLDGEDEVRASFEGADELVPAIQPKIRVRIGIRAVLPQPLSREHSRRTVAILHSQLGLDVLVVVDRHREVSIRDFLHIAHIHVHAEDEDLHLDTHIDLEGLLELGVSSALVEPDHAV